MTTYRPGDKIVVNGTHVGTYRGAALDGGTPKVIVDFGHGTQLVRYESVRPLVKDGPQRLAE